MPLVSHGQTLSHVWPRETTRPLVLTRTKLNMMARQFSVTFFIVPSRPTPPLVQPFYLEGILKKEKEVHTD